MNNYRIPLAKQELLHQMLQAGGTAVCPLLRPEQTIHASFEVELTDDSAVISVDFGGHTGELTLKRSDRANHLHLRDFIQDIANGRIESAEPAPPPEQPTRTAQIQQMLAESEALLNNVRELLAA
ncbi:hypothetical protein PspS04_11925 [Pseudomonas sp. S04]|uniref:hypothetical protein n=1 Tax=unclassified Pseudomonas TaxID=196821 RepID=UPI00131FBC0E|nr:MULTISPECIES: hypothetical protein [unclassified Pseudomonas]QHD01016.1 hypothetical protein PspS04_11925 [Pseudomonas sp. S04]QHF33500.1 hypothetical protein PspS19_11930 [Pseudomonas sp. S19]